MKPQASANEMILKVLKEKATLKQDVYHKTLKIFGGLKTSLQQMREEYRKVMKKVDERVLIDYHDKGDFEAELKVAGDAIIFIMHTNVFNFDKGHSIWKTSYVQEDNSRAYCGMICVYNFLADSFKYNRVNDVGYLIGRIFINKDLHFFVEGKRQLGFLYNDFDNAVLDNEKMKAVLESAILYCLDFDLYTPPYEEMKQVSVNEVIETHSKLTFTTGKRLGFRFQSDDDKVE